jgi:hypothetical protein
MRSARQGQSGHASSGSVDAWERMARTLRPRSRRYGDLQSEQQAYVVWVNCVISAPSVRMT